MCISTNRLRTVAKLYSPHLITTEYYDRTVDESTNTNVEKGTSLMRGLRSSISKQPIY